MKKILLILLLTLFFIPNVNAVTSKGWAFKTEQYDDVNIRSCSNSSCSTSLTVNSMSYRERFITATGEFPDIDYGYFTSVFSLNSTGYGNMIFSFNRYKAGYLYQYTSYICSSSSSWAINNQSTDIELYLGGYNDVVNKVGNVTYNNFLVQTLNTQPFSLALIDESINKCFAITTLFVPSVDAQNIGLVIDGTSPGNQTLTLIGQDWNYLGLYSGTIEDSLENIVSNSGLATATSVEEVQNSVNQVQEELSNVNDSITSTEGPTNLGALDNSAGWLPAGPVDSILNLPLSLLNSLLTAVSSTCQPLNITFPFVDFNYQLPCISSIYAKISGLNAIVDLIGYTVGVLILYYYFKHLYKWIDDKITMQNDNDWGGI